MPQVIYLTPDDRRALLAALKPGLVYTRPTTDVGTFIIAGVNLEFRSQTQDPSTKETA